MYVSTYPFEIAFSLYARYEISLTWPAELGKKKGGGIRRIDEQSFPCDVARDLNGSYTLKYATRKESRWCSTGDEGRGVEIRTSI